MTPAFDIGPLARAADLISAVEKLECELKSETHFDLAKHTDYDQFQDIVKLVHTHVQNAPAFDGHMRFRLALLERIDAVANQMTFNKY